MKVLRVLHVYRTYFPETQGGTQEAIRQLCLATQALGVENTIFTLAKVCVPARVERPEGVLVRARSWLEIASCNFGGLAAFRACRKAALGCDVIQVHYPWPFADVLLPFIRRPGQAVVVTFHSDIVRQGWLDKLYAPLRRYLLGSAQAIVATSPHYAQSSPLLLAYAAKVRSIPLCLQAAPPIDAGLRAHWAAVLGTGFFLFVGVLRYYKGLDFLIQAAAQVKHKFVLVGAGPEGERLRLEALRRGLTNVEFLGALPDADKNALMALCRAVVFPSHLRSEAFGVTLLEGARAAKPLVCCDIGTGTTWVNRHNETGLVVPPGDVGALVLALNTLAGDAALCERLGLGALARWQLLFTHASVGLAYRGLYDELCLASAPLVPALDAGPVPSRA
jgi:rhamnosyl/mannosyltransferase